MPVAQLAKIETNYSEASIIDRTDLLNFLETSLTAIGLNTKETADFITFWGPQMLRNEKNYVHFMRKILVRLKL